MMGFVEIIDGSGYLARLENDQITIEPTDDKCMACNDDRLLHDGNLCQIGRAHV